MKCCDKRMTSSRLQVAPPSRVTPGGTSQTSTGTPPSATLFSFPPAKNPIPCCRVSRMEKSHRLSPAISLYSSAAMGKPTGSIVCRPTPKIQFAAHLERPQSRPICCQRSCRTEARSSTRSESMGIAVEGDAGRLSRRTATVPTLAAVIRPRVAAVQVSRAARTRAARSPAVSSVDAAPVAFVDPIRASAMSRRPLRDFCAGNVEAGSGSFGRLRRQRGSTPARARESGRSCPGWCCQRKVFCPSASRRAGDPNAQSRSACPRPGRVPVRLMQAGVPECSRLRPLLRHGRLVRVDCTGTDASRGQPEVEDLHPGIAAGPSCRTMFAGFRSRMNDVLQVGGVEGVGDVPGDGESLGNGIGPRSRRSESVGPSTSSSTSTVRSGYPPSRDRTDVRRRQGREQACFAREARTALVIGDEDRRQRLIATSRTELAIASAIHLSHPASAKRAKNAIGAELFADPGGFAGTIDFHRGGRENGRIWSRRS